MANFSVISMGYICGKRRYCLRVGNRVKSQKVEPIAMGNDLVGLELSANQITSNMDHLDFRNFMKSNFSVLLFSTFLNASVHSSCSHPFSPLYVAFVGKIMWLIRFSD